MMDWTCCPELKPRVAVGLCLLLTAMGLGAQSQHEIGIEEEGAVKHIELTYGLNQSNLSLLRGVVIDTKLEPTLDVKLETDQGFFSLQNGLGWWLHHEPALKSGVSLNYMLGRHQSTDRHYQGLGDRSGSFDLFAFAEWQPVLDAVTLYANAASTPGLDAKAFAQAGATLGLPLFNPWNAFVDLNVTWGNLSYWQNFYGVPARSSTASMKGTFNPTQGGVLYQSKTVGGVYSLDRSIDLIVGVGTLEASENLMQSPLMGSRVQHTVMLMVNQKLISH
jgi:outer membrane scaffolding protein for murein synthesis (MipA/OmpV family)